MTERMRAIVQSRYGAPEEVLRLAEVDRPVAKDDEVLVRMHAASVHPDVWHAVRGEPYMLRLMGSGVRRPKRTIPGMDVAGTVVSVGDKVTGLRPGDAVFGETVVGHQWQNGGAYAEYVAVPSEVLVKIPEGVSFEPAAAVPTSGMIAWHHVHNEGKVQAGQRVLVNGAGGGVGGFVVQLAKATGAQVTAVDATHKLEMLRGLGADAVFDHTVDDVTRRDDRYDVVIDIPGNHPFRAWRRILAPRGTYLLIGHDQYGAAGRRIFGSMPAFMALVLRSPFSSHLPKPAFSMPPKREMMAELQALLATGRIRPVIDRTFPLEEAAAAIAYLASGAACGKVVLTA